MVCLRVGAALLWSCASIAAAPGRGGASPTESPSRTAGSEVVPFWPDVVDTVEVRSPAAGREQRLVSRTGFSTIVPLGPEVSASRDLGDLLDRVAGVHVHRYGGVGDFSTASIRGSSSAQVRVVLDGVPLSSSRDGAANLGFVPLALFDHAVVHRGAQTLHLAGPPAAGVVELRTPEAASADPVLGLAIGSFGTRSARGHWGGTHRAISVFLAGQHRVTDGDFRYENRNGTPLNPEDDRGERRRNNDHSDEAYLWKSSFRGVPGLLLDYTGQRASRREGVPGTEAIQTDHSRYRMERTRHQILTEWRTAGGGAPPRGPVLLRCMGFHDAVDDRFSNPEGEVGLGRVVEEGALRSKGVEGAIELPLVAGLRARVDHARSEETWAPRDALRDVDEYTRERHNRTTLVSAFWGLPRGPLTLEASYRWDRARDNYAGPIRIGRPPEPSPHRVDRFEAPTWGARLALLSGLSLHANRGRYLRRPTFPELFGSNGVQDGNPALRPERGTQWDVGIRFHRPRAQIDVAYFESVSKDEIALLQNSQRTVKAHNLDRTWARGVEASAYFAVPVAGRTRLEWETQVTWQEAEDIGLSRTYRRKEIPYLPHLEQRSAVTLARGVWRLDYAVDSRSSVYRDRYNTDEKKAESAVLHDAGVERDLFARRVTLRVEVINVWDHEAHDIEGYPLPGRSLTFELLLRPLDQKDRSS